MTIRVLVADDQKVVRDGLRLMLGMLPGIAVTGTAVDGADAVRQVIADRPDVVLMDLHMPNCDGVEATRRIMTCQPSVRVVVLTAYCDDDWVFGALHAGARGYLTKDASSSEIFQAVVTVCAGDAQLDTSVQRRVVDAIARGDRVGVPGRSQPAAVPAGLTEREVDVLTAVGAGLSNTEIAGQLRISVSTVKTHVNRLLAKTGMRDRAQLVGYAFRQRLVR
jgi:DNA-binding NarL/FixJ family response regulator